MMQVGAEASGAEALFVDGHVHLRTCFGPKDFLDAADQNFQHFFARSEFSDASIGCLLLADTPDRDGFQALSEASERGIGPWTVKVDPYDGSLTAWKSGIPRLLVIAGSQIATTEGLEVLALCCISRIEDGLPFEDTVHRAIDNGAVVIIPWGFGKWWGIRGRIVKDALEPEWSRAIFLADSGNRPVGWPEPSLLRAARREGRVILAGSDPLPYPADFVRAGSYGFILRGPVTKERPAETVRMKISQLQSTPQTFGNRTGWLRFVGTQLRMQMRKTRTAMT